MGLGVAVTNRSHVELRGEWRCESPYPVELWHVMTRAIIRNTVVRELPCLADLRRATTVCMHEAWGHHDDVTVPYFVEIWIVKNGKLHLTYTMDSCTEDFELSNV